MVASSTILKLLYAGGFSELLCIGGNGKYKNASEHEKPNCVAEPGVTWGNSAYRVCLIWIYLSICMILTIKLPVPIEMAVHTED